MSKTSLHILTVAMVVLVTLTPEGFAQTITTFDPTGSAYTAPPPLTRQARSREVTTTRTL
jgi:hypothetical protein